MWLLRGRPPCPPFVSVVVALLALLAAPLLSAAVQRPLLPLTLPSGCDLTLPLPLWP